MQKPISRGEIIKSYIPYLIEELEKGISVHTLIAPIQSLFQGQRGSKMFRQELSSSSITKDNVLNVINKLLEEMPPSILWEEE